MASLNEKTTIPLWSVFMAIPVLFGAVFWFSSLDNKTQANSNDISEIKPILLDIRERVIRIEQWQKDSKDKIVETESHHSGGITN